jgi:putative inorganic carbon (hco3(-)) transporter
MQAVGRATLPAQSAPVSWTRGAFYLTAAAAVTTEISIAAFQILMGVALVLLIISRATRGAARVKFRWPAAATPLAAWMAWTLVSLVAHGQFHAGFPQIKKFYVYLMLFLVAAAVRTVGDARTIVLGWAGAACLSAAWSMEQFARKFHAARVAHVNFYLAYVGARITGFMGHWMTFSGQMMMALLLILALLLLSREPQGKRWLGIWLIGAAGLVAAALLAAETRSMWGGAAVGAAYLLWFKRRWLILAIPVTLGVVLLTNPFDARERVISIVRPHGEVDSNDHRALLRRVGWKMIEAHPWVGLGPEEVGPNVARYIPADVPRPLPDGYYGHLHNIYFHYAAERGLPALALLLWFFLQALYDFARALRLQAASEARWFLHGAIAVILAFMLAGYFEVNWGDSEVLAMLLAVVGCGYALISPAPTP